MAKHAQTKNKTFSPQEELRVKEQELQMEQRRQLQVKQTMECERLETVLTEQKVKKLMYYPFAVGCLTVIVLILYAIVKGHCLVDLPLFILLSVLALVFLCLLQRENRKLCVRIEAMLEERRHN